MSPFTTFAWLVGFPVCAASAQVSWTVDERGALSAQVDGQPVLQDLSVLVPSPGWGGTVYHQLAEDGVIWDEGGGDGAVPAEFRGRLLSQDPTRESGRDATLSITYKPEGQGVRVRVRLVPEADVAVEGVFLTCQLPTAGNAGQARWWKNDGLRVESRFFPEVLPDPYHLTGGRALDWIGWTLPDGRGLKFALTNSGLDYTNLQDDRQFSTEAFSLQLRSAAGGRLEQRKPVVMDLLILPVTEEELAREQAEMERMYGPHRLEFTSRQPLELRDVALSERDVELYEMLELRLDLSATFDNPFDPRDIEVTAEFSGPSGGDVEVAGFYFQDYERSERAGRELLRPVGQPEWRVRFAPTELGTWSVVVRARDRTGAVESPELRFRCKPSDRPGFIRRSEQAEHYLQFDSGQPYFAVGENVCWAGTRQTFDYDEWFPALGAAGGNFARIWLVRWNMALEWTEADESGVGEYYGPGKYSMDNAWRLDYLLRLAERHGIYLMLSLGYHGELSADKLYFGEQCFDQSPYNKANGGSCETPEEFWTNEEARRLYKQRLRYYVARYAHSPHIHSWEFWNEVWAPTEWINEMAEYLREIDPYQHLRTTTYGHDDVWELPPIDYAQEHHYGSPGAPLDTVSRLSSACRAAVARHAKPFLIGEFGIDFTTSDTTYDPQYRGTSLHNGLWAATMSGSFGGAMIWYWDGYVHPGNLYHEFTALARFAATVDWHRRRFRPAETTPPLTLPSPSGRGQGESAPPEDAPWADVEYRPPIGFARAAETELTVGPEGRIEGEGGASQFLFAPSKLDLRRPLRFRVTAGPQARLGMLVGTVSDMAELVVKLDGTEVMRERLLAGEGEGPWQETTWREEWGVWQSRYDQEYTLEVPPGEHEIELSNEGNDWVSIPLYTFYGCRDPRYPAVGCLALRTRSEALLWIYDHQSTWEGDPSASLRASRDGLELPQWEGLQLSLLGLRDATYEIEWWDTRRGELIEVVRADCTEGQLPLLVPAFSRDIAAHVRRSVGPT